MVHCGTSLPNDANTDLVPVFTACTCSFCGVFSVAVTDTPLQSHGNLYDILTNSQ